MDEQLFNLAPCGLLVLGKDGEFLRANKTFTCWVQFEAGELHNMKFQQLLTMGGKIFYQTHLAPLLRMQGSITEVKLELRCKNSKTLPVILNAIEYNIKGEFSLHMSVFVATDRHKYEKELLYQRKRAEELAARHAEAQKELTLAHTRLRLALKSAALYGWDVDVASGTRRFDDAASRLLDSASCETFPPDLFLKAIHPEDQQREEDAFVEAMTGNGIYRCTYRLIGLDGQVRVISSHGRASFGLNGTPIHFVGILQDITSAVRQQSEAEDRALFAEQMVGIVSHDLRNPLSAISMNAQLLDLLQPQKDEKQKFSLGAIKRSVGRAQRLITDLLDFTQVRLGQRLSVNIARINLHEEIAEAMKELEQAFPNSVFVSTYSGSPWVFADSDRIVQALGNLVANAVTHGSGGEVITVRTEARGNHTYISVHNEGPEIPPPLLSRLFEPMIRGDVHGHGNSGVGLGLYIVREIVQRHGGTVQVTSTRQAGTTFIFTLPNE